MRHVWVVAIVATMWTSAAFGKDVNPYRGAADPIDDPVTIDLADGVVKIIPHAQYWARFETGGMLDFAPGTNVDFLTHRARLGATVKAWETVSAMIQIQDVRVWGEETDPLADDNAEGLDVHQAWAELRKSGAFIRLGRQEMMYDNHRLVGNEMWNMNARSFDAVRAGYESDTVKVHAWWAKTKETDLGTVHPAGGDFVGFWANINRSELFQPSLVMLYDRDAQVSQDRFTLGAYARGTPLDILLYEVEGYYQTGAYDDAATGARLNISAYLAAARLTLLMADLPMFPRVTAFFDYLSGDDDPTDGADHSFNTLFPSNHGFYGMMDLFQNLPSDTGNQGLIDAGGRLTLDVCPLSDVLFLIDFHHFAVPQAVTRAGNDYHAYGQEIDTLLRWTPFDNPQVTFEGGFGVFFPQVAAACVARGGAACRDANNWSGTSAQNEYSGWAMLNTTFN